MEPRGQSVIEKAPVVTAESDRSNGISVDGRGGSGLAVAGQRSSNTA
jgi:hypothetical protein